MRDNAGILILSIFFTFLAFYLSFNRASMKEDIEYRKEFFAKHKDAISAVVLNYKTTEHDYYFVTDSAIIDGCLIGKFYSTSKPPKSRQATFKRMTVCSEFQVSE